MTKFEKQEKLVYLKYDFVKDRFSLKKCLVTDCHKFLLPPTSGLMGGFTFWFQKLSISDLPTRSGQVTYLNTSSLSSTFALLLFLCVILQLS